MKWYDYAVDLVDPKTNEEMTVIVSVTELQRSRAKRSRDWMQAIQDIGRPLFPKTFMPIGMHVRSVN